MKGKFNCEQTIFLNEYVRLLLSTKVFIHKKYFSLNKYLFWNLCLSYEFYFLRRRSSSSSRRNSASKQLVSKANALIGKIYFIWIAFRGEERWYINWFVWQTVNYINLIVYIFSLNHNNKSIIFVMNVYWSIFKKYKNELFLWLLE